jgi:isopentenyl phosphate kinase
MDHLVFFKLGGSLITDKRREGTAREETIRRAAQEIHQALEERPDLRLVLGHGSGSFGHFAARRHGLLQEGPPNWRGYAETGAVAARLNRLVTDLLLAEGVPVVSLQPSASAQCCDGELLHMAVEPIRELLAHGLVPLVYGDVALDQRRGHTIISTEQIFAHLARHLRPARILLAGDVGGVFTADPAFDPAARLIPEITPTSLTQVERLLGGSAGIDVTGGMWAKVQVMVALVEEMAGLEVQLISGEPPGRIARTLVGRGVTEGTSIRADQTRRGR